MPTNDLTAGRDSVLLRFDPLLEKVKPIENNPPICRLSITKEEEEEPFENPALEFGERSIEKLAPPPDTSPSLSPLPNDKFEDEDDGDVYAEMKDTDQIENNTSTESFKEASEDFCNR